MNLKEKYESYFTDARPCQDSLKGQFGLFAVGKMIAGTACVPSSYRRRPLSVQMIMILSVQFLSKNTIPMLVFCSK